jgi:fibronectin-binding autotransporter adhesin
MKPKPTLRSFLTAIGASMVAASSASAQDTDGTWNANSAGNWSDTTKWSGGTVADGIGFSAFLSNVITDNRTITLDTARTIGSIFAQDTTHNFTISGANTLTLDASSGQSVLSAVSGRTLTLGTAVTVNDGIEKSGAGAVTISGAVSLGGEQTWINNSTGAFSTAGTTGLITNNGHQLTLDGTGTFNIGGITNANPAISGSGALVKNGSGRVNFGGVNSGFTGTVAINGGVMQVTNNAGALGAGNLSLNGGALSFYWGTTYTRSLGTGDNQVQILGGNSGFAAAGTAGATINLGTTVQWGSTHFQPGRFVLGDEGTTNVAPTTFSSGIDLNGDTRTILTPLGANNTFIRATISGAISNSAGTGNLVKEGGGYLLFSNNSSAWNGTTTVSEGLLDMGGLNENNIGGGSARNITVADGAVIRFNALSNAVLNRIVETTDEIGVMTGGTANSFDFSSSTGADLPNAFLGNFASNGAKAEISGTITPGSDGYKFGAIRSSGNLGILGAVTGANTLTVGQTGATGIRVTLAGAKDFTGETVINAGAKLTLGDNLALQNSPLNVGSAGGNIAFNGGTAAATITGNTVASSPTFGGLIGSRNLRSVYTNAGGNNESNLANNAIIGFTLNVGTGNTHTYSGSIGGFGTNLTTSATTGGNSTLTKSGAGTQVLTGIHTYTGATNVDGGTLEISGSGSINSSSAINVAGGASFIYNSSTALTVAPTLGGSAGNQARFSGSGTLSAPITLNSLDQVLAPGNSPGIQTFGVSQSWESFTYEWELNDWTDQVAGTNIDQIQIAGGLTLSGTLYALSIFSLDALNAAGLVGANGGNLFAETSNSWTILTTTGGISGFDASNWALDTLGFQDSDTGTWSLASTGNDLVLSYTVIPEPSTALLAALGVLALLRRRR